MEQPASHGLADQYALAYEEAKRAMDVQESVVNELRSRAAVLIAAAAVTTSFFGSRALTQSRLDIWAWLAIGGFALLGLSVLAILWPRHEWIFIINASWLIQNYLEHPGGALELPAIHRDLALHMSRNYAANASQLRLLFAAFRTGALLLVVEVAAWVVNLSAAT